MGIPWIRKYEPLSPNEIRGNSKGVKQLYEFITNFSSQKRNCLLLTGPTGCGKTSAVHAIARELKMELVEINASDFRNKSEIEARVGRAIHQTSLFRRKKLILIDEVDGLSGNSDRGGVAAIKNLVKSSSFPIILTANDPDIKKLAQLKKLSIQVEFKELGYEEVYDLLKEICKKEGVKWEEQALRMLARRAGGDARAAINDLQTLSSVSKSIKEKDVLNLSGRNKEEGLSQAITRIFKSRDLSIAAGALYSVNEDYDAVLLWLDENIPYEYKKAGDIRNAYYALSKANIFLSRIRRWQYWRFLVYVNFYLSAGVALAKESKYSGAVTLKRPSRPLKIWISNNRLRLKKAISEKIAGATHTSSKRTFNEMKFLSVIAGDKKVRAWLEEEAEITKEEEEWLLEHAGRKKW